MPEWSEILVILLVAMVVFGPHRLPAMAKRAGKMMAEFRLAARELREGLEQELAVEEMREVAKDVMATTKDTTGDLKKSLSESEKSLRASPPLASPSDTGPGAKRSGTQPDPPDEAAPTQDPDEPDAEQSPAASQDPETGTNRALGEEDDPPATPEPERQS